MVRFPAPTEEAAAAVVEPIVAAEPLAEVGRRLSRPRPRPAVAETTTAYVEPEIVVSEEAADAHDEAVLDLIAAEMLAAPEPVDDIDDLEMTLAEAPVAEPAPDGRNGRATDSEEAIAKRRTAVQPQAAIESVAARNWRQPAAELSLGSTILASGMLKKPRAAQRSAGADPPHESGRKDRVFLVNYRSKLTAFHVHFRGHFAAVPA